MQTGTRTGRMWSFAQQTPNRIRRIRSNYVARWYDPAIGRFIQADSIVPNPASAVGFDRYAYALNNPVKFTDPSGHTPIVDDCDFNGNCADTGTGGQVGILHDLPVSEDALEGIQPFGATNFAYRQKDGMYSYCQGFHCGIDFFANWGTPVQAGVYGIVIGIDWPYEGPYNIVIQSGDYIFKYGHLDGSEPPISIGEWVSPDTIIGYVGNMTGNPANGNIHIHFEVRSPTWSGLTYNPETVMALDVMQAYNDYLLDQSGYPNGEVAYPGALYKNTRSEFAGTKDTALPSEPWWQTPNTIRRVNDGPTLWP